MDEHEEMIKFKKCRTLKTLSMKWEKYKLLQLIIQSANKWATCRKRRAYWLKELREWLGGNLTLFRAVISKHSITMIVANLSQERVSLPTSPQPISCLLFCAGNYQLLCSLIPLLGNPSAGKTPVLCRNNNNLYYLAFLPEKKTIKHPGNPTRFPTKHFRVKNNLTQRNPHEKKATGTRFTSPLWKKRCAHELSIWLWSEYHWSTEILFTLDLYKYIRIQLNSRHVLPSSL